ncbi:hypothetical protein I8752_18745 [Nostocaceae cyanobacterium CENA369]|jgi:hypothetical protein|uniref:Uncharacterized protein n=1 Tax=Dendronalium phyllosphericum CENA369 TaxID=1725256 RepID=A0A8J7I8C1_9NOST|nr:hypothetical protein [Dendronalium phyllosphericum]MBH8575016.1 hypothetical protein [Dendronalium phyllosphericum CENA369]
MITRTLDLIFIDLFAFAINGTLGAVLRTKICNYSWDGKIKREPQTEQIVSNNLRQPSMLQDIEQANQDEEKL